MKSGSGGLNERMDVGKVICFIWTIHISEIILNPVCFTISFNIPYKVAVKGEPTGAWLAEKPGSCQ